MHPSRLNLSETNPQGIIMTSGTATTEVSKTINEEGLYSLLESNADWLTRTLIHPYYDDLILIFDGLHEESEAAVLQSLQIESMWSTKNEIRARRNLPPLSDLNGGEVIMDGMWLQWVNMKKQEKAQKDAQKQYEKGNFAGQPGQPGAPGADGAPGAAPPGAEGAPAGAPPGAEGAPPGGPEAAGGPPQGGPPGGDEAAAIQQMMGGAGMPGAPTDPSGGAAPPQDAGGQGPQAPAMSPEQIQQILGSLGQAQ
jgi:hypothetical protein